MQSTAPLVDLEFGLSQLSGKRDLLISLLGKFMDEYSEFETRLAPLMGSDTVAAKQQVHTLKGVSGNLGLKALHDAAKALEGDIIQEASTDASYRALVETLQATNAVIRQLSEPQREDTVSDAPPAAARQHNPAPLLEALERNEYIPPDKLNTLMDNIQCDEATRASIVDAINDLDYAKAISLLR